MPFVRGLGAVARAFDPCGRSQGPRRAGCRSRPVRGRGDAVRSGGGRAALPRLRRRARPRLPTNPTGFQAQTALVDQDAVLGEGRTSGLDGRQDRTYRGQSSSSTVPPWNAGAGTPFRTRGCLRSTFATTRTAARCGSPRQKGARSRWSAGGTARTDADDRQCPALLFACRNLFVWPQQVVDGVLWRDDSGGFDEVDAHAKVAFGDGYGTPPRWLGGRHLPQLDPLTERNTPTDAGVFRPFPFQWRTAGHMRGARCMRGRMEPWCPAWGLLRARHSSGGGCLARSRRGGVGHGRRPHTRKRPLRSVPGGGFTVCHSQSGS